MSEILSEASKLIQDIGASCRGPKRSRIDYAAKRLGWIYSRVKDIWYADPRTRIDAEQIQHLKFIALQVERERAIEALVVVGESLARGSARHDREAAAYVASALRRLRGEDRPGNAAPGNTGEG